MEKEDFHIMSISVPDEMWQYLQKNPGINRSLIFRDKVNEIRTDESMRKSFFQFQCHIIFLTCLGVLLYFLWPRSYFIFLFIIYVAIVFWIMLKALFFSIEYNEVKEKWKNRYSKKIGNKK